MDATLRKSVDEVHRHINACAERIVDMLVQHQHLPPTFSAEFMLYASQLYTLLPDVSKPPWLIALFNQFQNGNLSTNFPDNKVSEFASFILTNLGQIKARILSPDEVAYDFDLTFDEARESQNIAATFDILVEQLETIIAADMIDSRVVQETLERLLALLKRNKHGSLTSILVSMHYGRFFLKSFEGILTANKYLKPIVETFKVEFAIAEGKIQKAEATLKEEAIRRLTNQERLMTFIETSGGDTSVVADYLGQHDSDANDVGCENLPHWPGSAQVSIHRIKYER